MKPLRRTPKGYCGTVPTTRQISDLMPQLVAKLTAQQSLRPEMVLALWPEVIGAKLAPMTKAVSFCEGVLTVLVNNSALYSLLQQYEKARLLSSLRAKFPHLEIKALHFRLG